MKQLFTFVLAAMAFAACTQNEFEELTADRADVPETLTVGFEGGDTRIELNKALKTVWTEGDEVSVFYQSYDNMRWAFQGTTGDRSGELKLVSGEITDQTMDNIIVAYPYDANYRIDIEDKALHASLPAVQSYKEGSYGAEGNIMVAESDYRQFILKSVVGWLRIELTGEGESVKSITLRGNAGEQVAGDILVNAADASCILASEGAAAEDNSEVAGNLMLEESILTEITLNCGSGVELGAKAKSFYIGLLPQTFEEGITVEVECGNGTSTTKSTAGKLVVERNHIVPMESFKYDGVLPEVYELAYTTNDGKALDPYTTEGFGTDFVENIYDAATGRGVLKFAGAVTTIPEQAFAICENLTWIDLPEGITTIGASAFTGCTALEELTIPSTLTSLGSEAFKNCSFKATINCENISFSGAGFTEVIIGDSVTTIGYRAFYNCDSLTSVTIPDSVTTIGNYAFRGCDSLTSVTIGNGVTTIGDYAFYECSLTSVYITDIAAWCNISFGDLSSNPLYYAKVLYLNNELVTELTIPDSVTTIGDYAFYSCDSLTSVYCKATTPPTLGGSRVFDSNVDGRKIYVPEGSLRAYKMAENWSNYADRFVEYYYSSTLTISYTTSDGMPVDARAPIVSNSYQNGVGELKYFGKDIIPEYLFYNCDNLTSVTIPDGVTTIGSKAFSGCTSLTSVTIGDSVTTIGEYAFNSCGSLTSVYITDVAAWCNISFGDQPLRKGADLYLNNELVTELTIPDSVTAIGKWAFDSCSSLTSITIPDSVTTIGDEAFHNCSSLTSVTIGNSVTTIGSKAFYYCNSLTSVTIPDSVTTIGEWAFYYCRSLTSVTIPDSVTTIGENAFYECTSLTSVTIGNSVTTIGNWAFGDCSSLTSVTIPDSITTIGDYAFYYCRSLTSVTIPDSVTTIGNWAFGDCSSLTSVYCKPTTPPTLGSSVFDFNKSSGRKIYVSAESVEAYKAATNWSEYAADIVGYDFENGVVVE